MVLQSPEKEALVIILAPIWGFRVSLRARIPMLLCLCCPGSTVARCADVPKLPEHRRSREGKGHLGPSHSAGCLFHTVSQKRPNWKLQVQECCMLHIGKQEQCWSDWTHLPRSRRVTLLMHYVPPYTLVKILLLVKDEKMHSFMEMQQKPRIQTLWNT